MYWSVETDFNKIRVIFLDYLLLITNIVDCKILKNENCMDS